jgi:3D (Asp-Asp-Asp) domain-containing protein
MKTRNKIVILLAAVFIATTGFQETETEEQRIKAKAEEIRIRETAKVQELIDKDAERPKKTSVGTYELTAYIATGSPCADGVYPQTGHTAACNDPALWHKWIEVEGYGIYYVHDTGGMASNVIDIFMGSYDEAIQFGRRTAEVYIIE